MTHVTGRLTAKNRDQLPNPTLGNRVWATFTFTFIYGSGSSTAWRLTQLQVRVGTARIFGGVSMQLSDVRASLRLSGGGMPLLLVSCCGPGGRVISIDCCTAGGPAVSSSSSRAAARLAAANTDSATLSADVES